MKHIGDFYCDPGLMSPSCCLDGGDCQAFIAEDLQCPSCLLAKSNFRIGDNVCHPFLNMESCCFDAGDCSPQAWLSRSWCASCSSSNTFFELYLMNGICEEQYNRPECCYDGQDCSVGVHSKICPTCQVENLQSDYLINNNCDLLYNNPSCCYDAGSCLIDNDQCRSCTFPEDRQQFGDGICDAFLQSPECCYDGNDCQPQEIFLGEDCQFCQVANAHIYLGNGRCDQFMDNVACCFDGGDCSIGSDLSAQCHDCDRGTISISAGFCKHSETFYL